MSSRTISRQYRLYAGMQSRSIKDFNHGKVVKLDDIIQNHPISNDDHTIQDLHDICSPITKRPVNDPLTPFACKPLTII